MNGRKLQRRAIRAPLLAVAGAVAISGLLLVRAAEEAEPAAPGIGGSNPLELHSMLAGEFAEIDPGASGWRTESLSEAVTASMKGVAKLLVHPEDLEPAKLAPLLAEGFVSAPLHAGELEPLGGNVSLSVRGVPGTGEPKPSDAADFGAALRALAGRLGDAGERRAKFKVMTVELDEGLARTRLLFEMRGRREEGWLQVTASWLCEWTLDDEPRLRSIRVVDYREAQPGSGGRVEFKDVAPQVLAGTEGYGKHLAYSFDYWRARSDRALVSDLLGRQGVAVADVNGDGLEDIYMMQPGGLPNRLFIHQPDGTASDGAAEAGVDFLDFGRSSLLIDIDNDGDRDLVVGFAWKIQLMENDGTGKFELRGSYPSDGQINSLGAADYDNDGDLDIYVCGQHPSSAIKAELGVLGIPMPYYDANNGGPNKLYRNEGAFSFSDVTEAVGMNVNNTRFSLACAWEDFDNDGDQDLYVANDFGRNYLWRNDPGANPDERRFTNIAAAAGVEDIGPGMSVAWSDCNGDGLLDLYVANMWSSAGNRITTQEQFLPEVGPDAREEVRDQAKRHARGNSVYLNNGDGTFTDMTPTSGANMARWAWSSNFIEFDNDGHQDIVVANGMLTTRDTGDL